MSTARMQKCCLGDSDQNRQEQEEASPLSFPQPAASGTCPLLKQSTRSSGQSRAVALWVPVGPSPSIAEQSMEGQLGAERQQLDNWRVGGERDAPFVSPDSPLV